MSTDKITEALADAARFDGVAEAEHGVSGQQLAQGAAHRCPQCPGCNQVWHVCPTCGKPVYH